MADSRDLERRVTQLELREASLSGAVEALKVNQSELEDRLDELEEKLDELESLNE